jgi:site-specific DNA recombinase
MTGKTIRCAVYTRKSTEEGLDKEFNSLDAQREACESYIRSQMHEGWRLLPTLYDDGGYSGGNMERPALKALMADIKAGKIDVVVVYKVDRLSRSLHDFAQMVNVFDAQQVSFVSITQQFNTTTSMGRLTLNILLSFAQFEREVIGERVRDKIAASKRKGMWMGGNPPLGYAVDQRKLVIIPEEAALVRDIFKRYMMLKSCYHLSMQLNAEGHHNKLWTSQGGKERGGQSFTYQALYKILNNPIYIGQIRHKDKTYDGQHEAILPLELWEQVQTMLKGGREVKKERTYKRHRTMLAGKCFSPAGEVYTPTYTTKRGKVHYRYYLLKATGHRIKGLALETLVCDVLRTLAPVAEHWQECWKSNQALVSEQAQHWWESLWKGWPQLHGDTQIGIMQQVLDRVVITHDTVKLRLSYEGIQQVITNLPERSMEGDAPLPEAGFLPWIEVGGQHLDITVAASFKTYGRTQLAVDAQGKPVQACSKTHINPTLVNALVKSYRWDRMLQQEQITLTELAKQEGIGRTYIARIVNLMFLAPDIITAILTGTQPPNLQLQDLVEEIPIEWELQRAKFLG